MAQAAEVTRAVFLVLGRRARKLGRKTVLVDWLFHVTAVASRKVKRTRWWHRFGRKRQVVVPANATLWMRVAPEIDRALAHLPRKQRTAALLCGFLNFDFTSASRILRTREPRARKWFARALKKLAKRLRKYVSNIERLLISTVL